MPERAQDGDGTTLEPPAKPAAKPPRPETQAESESPTGEFTAAPSDGDGLPTTIGIYKVEKLLGQGGMGAVYLAEDPTLQRKVALKVMKPSFAANPVARERFVREARAAAKVESDHIIRVYAVGEDRGMPFIAMEYLKGKPVDAWLKEAKPTVKQVARMGYETALGLHAAHKAGLIHRDIKPANLWLEFPTGRVKILDFGLARPTAEDTHLTKSGVVVGTPAYMSPEQGRGKDLDHRTDLFSLGCVLYHLATGRRPFTGANTYEIIASLIADTPTPPAVLNPAIPAALSGAIMQMLEKDAAKRPAKARTVADAMATVLRELNASKDFVPTPLATPAVAAAAPPMATSTGTTTAWDNLDDSGSAVVAVEGADGRPVTLPKIAKVTPPKHSMLPYVVGSAVAALFVLGLAGMLVYKVVTQPTGTAEPEPDKEPPKTKATLAPAKPGSPVAADVPGKVAPKTPRPATATAGAIDLLALVDPEKDKVRGAWDWKEWDLSGSSASENAGSLQLPYHVPAEYDLNITFTQRSGTETSFGLTRDGRPFKWHFNDKGHGFDVEPASLKVWRPEPRLTIGRRTSLRLEVRQDRLTAAVDGQAATEFTGDASTLMSPPWHKLRDNGQTGILLGKEAGVTIHRVQLVEVSGAGRFTRPAVPTGPPDATFFNAKDLTGWSGEANFWRVEDGQLVGEPRSTGGAVRHVASARTARDFVLAFEARCRMDDPTGRVQGCKLDFRYPPGTATSRVSLALTPARAGDLFGTEPKPRRAAPAAAAVLKDDFNKYVLRVAGSRVTTWVNGVLAVDGEVPDLPAEGVFRWSLKEADELRVRNVRYFELTKPAPPAGPEVKAAE